MRAEPYEQLLAHPLQMAKALRHVEGYAKGPLSVACDEDRGAVRQLASGLHPLVIEGMIEEPSPRAEARRGLDFADREVADNGVVGVYEVVVLHVALNVLFG